MFALFIITRVPFLGCDTYGKLTTLLGLAILTVESYRASDLSAFVSPPAVALRVRGHRDVLHDPTVAGSSSTQISAGGASVVPNASLSLQL